MTALVCTGSKQFKCLVTGGCESRNSYYMVQPIIRWLESANTSPDKTNMQYPLFKECVFSCFMFFSSQNCMVILKNELSVTKPTFDSGNEKSLHNLSIFLCIYSRDNGCCLPWSFTWLQPHHQSSVMVELCLFSSGFIYLYMLHLTVTWAFFD